MGIDPTTSVTDPDGRVWGHSNLRVIDGSLHVTNGGVNPVLTIFANAFRIMHAWVYRPRLHLATARVVWWGGRGEGQRVFTLGGGGGGVCGGGPRRDGEELEGVGLPRVDGGAVWGGSGEWALVRGGGWFGVSGKGCGGGGGAWGGGAAEGGRGGGGGGAPSADEDDRGREEWA